MAVREGAITAAHCLSKRPGIPSDPVAFRGSIDSRFFRTVPTDTGEKADRHSGKVVSFSEPSRAGRSRCSGRRTSVTTSENVLLRESKLALGGG